MSAERAVPAPHAATGPVALGRRSGAVRGKSPAASGAPRHVHGRLAGWTSVRAIVAAALVASASCGAAPPDYVVVRSTAPDGRSAAEVRLTRCGSDWCHALWMGPEGDAALLATMPASSERCDEIAWSPDGIRAGFLINGYQLRLYDAATHAPAGQLDLVPADGISARLARGITFSENGAAVTYDDCPRDRSGCRPGIVAIR